MNKIRKGDTVVVLTGKDKGKTGVVLKVSDKKDNLRSGLWVTVEGINVAKKHVKANPQMQKPGGIIATEMPIHGSNVSLIDPTTQKPSRVGFKTLEDGKKVRFYKSSGEVCHG